MNDRCFPLEELKSLIDLSPDDPRRLHLAECPLCRARLAAYRTFIEEGPPLAGSEPERADAELSAYIEKMVHSDTEARARGGFLARFRRRRISKRMLMPGLAAAAVAIVVLIIALSPFPGGDRRQLSPLRGWGSREAELEAGPATLREGAVRFEWKSNPEADRYEVQLFDASLREIARFDAGRATSLTVQTSEMPETGDAIFWRIVAFRGGDELAHSPPRPLVAGSR